MYRVENFLSNNDIVQKSEAGPFTVIEYQTDLSVNATSAEQSYFMQQMNVRKRQVVCNLEEKLSIITQAGAMQWTVGNVKVTTGIKSAGDLVGKMFKAAVTNETMIKPEYVGKGALVLEPTYKHLFMLNPADYGGKLVLDDGLFLCCEGSLQLKLDRRKNISSTLLGNEGFWNTSLVGDGYVVIESDVPREELIEITLQDDELRVDGALAVAWSGSLDFSVQTVTRNLIGSAASGEGLVNVYKGTGKVLMSPVSVDNFLAETELIND